MSFKKDLKTIAQRVIAQGLLNEDEKRSFEKALRSLDHSVDIKDLPGIRKSINMIGKIFLK